MATSTPLVLCYIQHSWAYFTSQPLADQSGGGWHQAPYEWNADPPDPPDPAQPNPIWHIVQIAYACLELDTPADRARLSPYAPHGSRYSVAAINARSVPWLAPWSDRESAPAPIWAGTPLPAFIRAIRAAGGTVYLPYHGPAGRARRVVVREP